MVREEIDADVAGDEPLGSRDIMIAGTYDHIAGGSGTCAIGERRNGVRPADPENAVDIGHRRCREHQRRWLRTRDPHLAHAGGPSGHRGHQNRRWQGVAPPGA